MSTQAHAETAVAPRRRRRPISTLIVPAVGLSLVAIVVGWLLVNLVKDWSTFLQLTFSGLTRGSLYALVALGYTLVYGILELINFAHGDVFMLGGMMSVTLVGTTVFNIHQGQAWHVLWPLVIVALLVAMAFCGTLNVTVELIGY